MVHLVDLTFTELLKLSLTIRVSGRVITDKAIANAVSVRIIHRVIDIPDSAHIFMVTPLLIHIGEILVSILYTFQLFDQFFSLNQCHLEYIMV